RPVCGCAGLRGGRRLVYSARQSRANTMSRHAATRAAFRPPTGGCSMRKTMLALGLLAACAMAFAADDDQAKKDLKALQGTWTYGSHTVNGKQTPEENYKDMTLTIKDEKWEVKKGDKVVLAGTVKLDPSKKPKAADWTVTTEGDLKDKTALAIYKIDKDTFEHCYGQERPEKFESKEDSKITHTVFKRAKA